MQVYRGLKDGITDVAIKTLLHRDEATHNQFLVEINLLRSLSFDRHMVQFYGACLTSQFPMLVLVRPQGSAHRAEHLLLSLPWLGPAQLSPAGHRLADVQAQQLPRRMQLDCTRRPPVVMFSRSQEVPPAAPEHWDPSASCWTIPSIPPLVVLGTSPAAPALRQRTLQEYCEGGDLRNALDKPSLAVALSWDKRGHTLGMDIAAGLNFLHGKKVSPGCF